MVRRTVFGAGSGERGEDEAPDELVVNAFFDRIFLRGGVVRSAR